MRENATTDEAGNGNAEASLAIEIDSEPPIPRISTGVASPTNAQEITFRIDFGAEINATSFEPADIEVSGGTASGIRHLADDAFEFAVAPAAEGEVSAHIPAGGVAYLGGWTNGPSDTLVVSVDWTRPSLQLSTDATSPTSKPTITFTADFGEPVDGFGLGGITVSAGAASNPRADPQGQNRTFAFDVTHGLGSGNLTVGVRENATTDEAGNGNEAASHSIEVDVERPAPQLTTDAASPTNAQSVTIGVDFMVGINATSFEPSDIEVTGGDASGIRPVGGSAFEFAVTPHRRRRGIRADSGRPGGL